MLQTINLRISFSFIFISLFLFSCAGSKGSSYKASARNGDKAYKTLAIKLDKKFRSAKITLADSLTSSQADSGKINKIMPSKDYLSPFCPSTDVYFEVIEAGDISFEVYDLKGNLIGKDLFPALLPGKYKINMNLTADFDSGVYFYRLVNGNEKTQIKKIILLR